MGVHIGSAHEENSSVGETHKIHHREKTGEGLGRKEKKGILDRGHSQCKILSWEYCWARRARPVSQGGVRKREMTGCQGA